MTGFDIDRRGLLRATGGGLLGAATAPGPGTASGDNGEATGPNVVSSSVRHVGGTEPDMEDVVVAAEVRGENYVMVHVDALDRELQEETEEDLPRRELRKGDLEMVGADRSTTFEVELVVESYTPRLLVGRSRGLQWERDGRDDGSVAITVQAKPAEKQIITEDPSLEDWPEGEDDRATRAVSRNVSFAIYAHEDHPEEFRERIGGTAVGSDAQVIGTPALRTDEQGRDRLEFTVAGPHYTVSGDVHDGFYRAVLAPPLLGAWGVSAPGQLVAWYDGDEADFSAEWAGDAILIEAEIHYSVGTVAIGPGEPSRTTPAGEPDEDSAQSTPADEETPGFGILPAAGGVGVAGWLLKRRSGDGDS